MIRKATIEDIPAIMVMAEVVFRQTYATILSPEQMDYMMDMMYSETSLMKQMTQDGHIFFIEDGRGYVSYRHQGLDDDGYDVFHLEKLYVMPAEQKTGFGRVLFDTIVNEVKAYTSSHKRLELNVNRENPALDFYEHLGMRRDRQGDFPIGNGFYMNDYIMAIDL